VVHASQKEIPSRAGTSKRRGLDAHTLPAEDVEQELSGPVVLVHPLALLCELNILEVLLEEVGAVHGTALGLGVELGREDGAGLVHHALVASVVEVDEILLEVAGEGARVDGVAVVLAGDVALAGGQVEGRDVVGAVAVLELDGAGTDGKSEQLVAEADAHDGDGGGLHKASEVVDSLLAVGRVTGTVGDEDTIVVLSDLVDGVVVGEDGDGRATADEASKDVLLDTAVQKSDVEGSTGGLDNKGSLGADTLDEVDLARVDEALVLIGVILIADGDSSKRRALLSKVGDDGTSVDAGDGGDTLTRAPLAQALNGSPMAVVDSNIGDYDARALNVGRLEVLEQVPLVTLVRRHAIVSNEWLREDENLTSVGRVGHGLGVTDKRGSEDGLSTNVGVGTKGLALENGTIPNGEGRGQGGGRSGGSRGEGHGPTLASALQSLTGHGSELESNSARGRHGGLSRGFGMVESHSSEDHDGWRWLAVVD
jgi:hypothetical protein